MRTGAPDVSRRQLLGFGIAAGLMPGVVLAEDGALLRRKMIHAGRQRMLSQRIARAALFRTLDVEPGLHKRMLKQAHGQFDRALTALEVGDSELDLPAEGNATVLARLAEVREIWVTMGPAAQRMISPKTETPEDQGLILEGNLPLLAASDAVVKALALEYGDTSDPAQTIAVNLAARQRMLTQKMAKEVATVVIASDTSAAQLQLAKTIETFEGALGALTNGLPSVTLPPPPPEIRAKLEEVAEVWQGFGKIVRFVAETGIASSFELSAVTAQCDPLLKVMDEAVQMYRQS